LADGRQPGVTQGSALTASELRLLPLLTTDLSLNEIAQILELPRSVVMALVQSIYAKLGPLRESASRVTAP
jgi:DNA-binding CsgD family transcriptional regulator